MELQLWFFLMVTPAEELYPKKQDVGHDLGHTDLWVVGLGSLLNCTTHWELYLKFYKILALYAYYFWRTKRYT